MKLPILPLPPFQILVVDDHPEIRQVIAEMLTLEGYRVQQAENGKTALESMRRSTPDLILSDMNMPEMDGITLLKEVKQTPGWSDIPFIFTTSDNSSQVIQLIRQVGADDYLIKPVDYSELARMVNARLLRQAHTQLASLSSAYLETVNLLAMTIEGRDPYTRGHVERLTRYSRWIGESLKWPEDQMRRLELGAHLHDIGKIIIPEPVLNKPGALSPQEWSIIKQHTVAGAKLLQNIGYLEVATSYVLNHHERWDGSGYPHGLKKDEIPLEGRLLAIVDSFDALTTTRPYHPPRPLGEVIEYLKKGAGTLFDPDLTLLFIDILNQRVKTKVS